MIFENISILDENFTIQRGMNVKVDGARIAAISNDAIVGDDLRYDGKDKLLMPAFFNAHAHSPMTMLRGYGENLPLDRWLNELVFPYEDRLTGEDVYYATLLAQAEGLRFGVVGTTDMYFFCEDMARAIVDGGTKSNLSIGVTCFDGSGFYSHKAYKGTERLFDEWNGVDGITVEACLHGEYTSNEKLVRELAEFASEKGLGMHVHVAETLAESKGAFERHGKSVVKYLYDCGMFNTRTTAAHCVHLSGGDLELFAEKGVTIATCPTSNLKLGSGVFDYRAAQNAKLNIALGTDSVCSNNCLDMLAEIKLLSILHKGVSGDATLVTPEDAVRCATINGAKSQGRVDSGSIKVGNAADLTVLDVSAPHWYPQTDLLNNLVYSGIGEDVVLTMCNGRVLYKNGEYTTIDIERVKAEVSQRNDRIRSELRCKR